MQFIKIVKDFVIFKEGNKIIKQELMPEAKQVLQWNWKNIPANQ